MTDGRPAVFFDRDGTLIDDVGYMKSPEDVRVIPGTGNAIHALNERGVLVVVISNQSGVARGLLTEDDLLPIHTRMRDALAQDGGRVDRIYYCPHHPTEGNPPYRIACSCRKPGTGMLQEAVSEFSIGLQRSYVVGDKSSDIRAGIAAGARTVLVLTGYGPAALEECRANGIHPDAVCPSVVEAVEYILEQQKRESHNHA